MAGIEGRLYQPTNKELLSNKSKKMLKIITHQIKEVENLSHVM